MKKIKGIKIINKEVLLSQIADDTTLCLAGSEGSFNECIQTFRKFALISLLKTNNEKTQVVCTGSRKKLSGTIFKGYEFLLRNRNFLSPWYQLFN